MADTLMDGGHLMVLEEDRWPGVSGPFMVSKDGTPIGHTAVRQDDPDLAVLQAYDAARDRTRKVRMEAERIGDNFRYVFAASEIPGATKTAMRQLLDFSDRLQRALLDEDDVLRDWAVVLNRIGFKDAFGIEHPLPEKLAALLPDDPAG
jgi:hypothetical protein